MGESYKPIPPLPASELPPEYSRAPPLLQSFSSQQVQLTSHQRFLPGDYDDPPPFSEPSNTVLTPPQYSAFDDTISSFELLVPLIHTRNTGGETRPRYQLSQEFTKSGKPWRLKIRRLLPTESRRLSIPTPSSSKARVVEYDDDTTLYIVEDVGALNPFKGQSVEIRGRRAKTLPGIIKFQHGGRNAGICDFWHMTRYSANSNVSKENEKKMQKYGYNPDDEWKKRKLFSSSSRLGRANKVDWKNDEGKIIATEDGNAFDVVEGVDQRTKDALITCFVARRWAFGRLNWTNEKRANHESLELVRAVTTSN